MSGFITQRGNRLINTILKEIGVFSVQGEKVCFFTVNTLNSPKITINTDESVTELLKDLFSSNL